MKIITLDGTSIAVGLDWEVLDTSKGDRKAFKEALANYRGAKYGVRVDEGGLRGVGFVAQVGIKQPKVPSGAAWLALANQAYDGERSPTSGLASTSEETNWILVEQVSAQEYWLAIIKDSLPMPGSDVVATRKEILELVESILSSSPNFLVHSPDEEVRNHLALKCATSNKGFKDLTHNIKASKAAIKQIAGINSMVVTVGILLLVVIALGMGYQYFVKKSREAAAAAQNAMSAAAEEEMIRQSRDLYAQQVRSAILAALAEGKAAVEGRLAKPVSSSVVEAWAGAPTSLPFNSSGWLYSGVDCALKAAVPSCVFNYSRGPNGVNRLLMLAVPQAKIVGEAAQYTQELSSLEVRKANWKRLKGAKELSFGLVSDLQMLQGTGVTYKLGESKEIEQPVNVPPPPKSIFKAGQAQPVPTSAPVQMGVAAGTLTLTGANIWQLNAAGRLANNPALSVSSVKFMPSSSDWSWTLELEYLIRTAPKPTLPIVALPDSVFIEAQLPKEYEDAAREDQAAGSAMEGSSNVPQPVAPVPGSGSLTQEMPPAAPPPSLTSTPTP